MFAPFMCCDELPAGCFPMSVKKKARSHTVRITHVAHSSQGLPGSNKMIRPVNNPIPAHQQNRKDHSVHSSSRISHPANMGPNGYVVKHKRTHTHTPKGIGCHDLVVSSSGSINHSTYYPKICHCHRQSESGRDPRQVFPKCGSTVLSGGSYHSETWGNMTTAAGMKLACTRGALPQQEIRCINNLNYN